MSSACEGVYRKKGRQIEVGEKPPFGNGFFASVFVYDHKLGMFFTVVKRLIYYALVADDCASYYGKIRLFDLSSKKVIRELPLGRAVFRENHHAAGVFIEAVNEAQFGGLLNAELLREEIHKLGLTRPVFGHRYARGLIYDEDIVILVDYLNRIFSHITVFLHFLTLDCK
jgi:hypothetical protein